MALATIGDGVDRIDRPRPCSTESGHHGKRPGTRRPVPFDPLFQCVPIDCAAAPGTDTRHAVLSQTQHLRGTGYREMTRIGRVQHGPRFDRCGPQRRPFGKVARTGHRQGLQGRIAAAGEHHSGTFAVTERQARKGRDDLAFRRRRGRPLTRCAIVVVEGRHQEIGQWGCRERRAVHQAEIQRMRCRHRGRNDLVAELLERPDEADSSLRNRVLEYGCQLLAGDPGGNGAGLQTPNKLGIDLGGLRGGRLDRFSVDIELFHCDPASKSFGTSYVYT